MHIKPDPFMFYPTIHESLRYILENDWVSAFAVIELK